LRIGVHEGHVDPSRTSRNTTGGGAAVHAVTENLTWAMYHMVHSLVVETQGAVTVATAGTPRERLLRQVLDHVVARGLGDLSLREVAAAIGTSHRMLIYHFGSKEGLVVEVIRAVEAEQRALFADITADPSVSPVDAARRMWRRFTDPAVRPHERLFFEVYGQAIQGRQGTVGLLDGIIDSWAEPIAEAATAQGTPPAEARAQARLSVAVTRGLLLDLLATGDLDAVNAAYERFLTLTFAGRW
jgi:AcrR family transcriptional regulator